MHRASRSTAASLRELWAPGILDLQAAGSGTNLSRRFPRASENRATWAKVDRGLSSALLLTLLRHRKLVPTEVFLPSCGQDPASSQWMSPGSRPAQSRHPRPVRSRPELGSSAGGGWKRTEDSRLSRLLEEEKPGVGIPSRLPLRSCGQSATTSVRTPSGEARTSHGSKHSWLPPGNEHVCRRLPSQSILE